MGLGQTVWAWMLRELSALVSCLWFSSFNLRYGPITGLDKNRTVVRFLRGEPNGAKLALLI